MTNKAEITQLRRHALFLRLTMRARFAAVLIVTAFAASLEARAVRVHVVPTSCTATTLHAVAADGTAIERRWTGDDVSFDLPDGAWTIRANAPDCWAAPVAVDGDAVRIALWPAATLRVHVAEPRDLPVQLRIASADGKIAPVLIDCPGTCSVPATTLDLRLGADGFVPQYLWGKEVAPKSRLDLGNIRLLRGASVSGRVTILLKEPTLDAIAVQLLPGSVAVQSVDPRRTALLTQSVKTNGRGFFQFAGVDEGTYTVVARTKGWSPARAEDVHVVAGAEVVLPKPLALAPLAKLEVAIDPPTDAGGKPWHVELRPYLPSVPVEAIRSAVSPAGVWSQAQLDAGLYDLSVDDAAGSALRHQIVEVTDGMAPLRISIDSFRIRGRVTFRGEPLECGVWLAHPMNASASIRFRSDKEGKFETILPEEGTWRAQLALSKGHAQLPDVDIHRRSDGAPVDVDLVLPAGRIRGTTVDENGVAIPSSIAIQRNGAYVASISTDDGHFDLIGAPLTDVVLHARNIPQDRDGGLVPYHVTEAADEPITIQLPKRKKAKVWVATPDGRPIAGALVRYLSAGNVKEEVTGPGGELTFPLPRNETSVPLVILPPGLPRKMTTLVVGAEAVEVMIAPLAARLLLQHTPKSYGIVHEGAFFTDWMLFEPSYGARPREATGRGYQLDLEPGSYAICSSKTREQCKTFVLQAGTTTIVDMQLFR